MSDEIVVKDATVDKNATVENDQMAELKKAAHELIDKADGFLLFPYALTEVEQNGQKGKIAKSMIKETGAMGGGAVNISHTAKMANALLQMENQARSEQVAKLAE